jgi:hypothetical protein
VVVEKGVGQQLTVNTTALQRQKRPLKGAKETYQH